MLSLQGTLRMIHVSVDQGETWNMAQLPPVGHEQFYSILAANDDMVFMHVDEPGGQSVQQLDTSSSVKWLLIFISRRQTVCLPVCRI